MADAPVASDISVQICYALPDRQILLDLKVEGGTTLYQAVKQGNFLHTLPEIDLSTSRVGIHGKLKTLDTVLRDGDRIEIYRPLVADPKDARRARAGKKT